MDNLGKNNVIEKLSTLIGGTFEEKVLIFDQTFFYLQKLRSLLNI